MKKTALIFAVMLLAWGCGDEFAIADANNKSVGVSAHDLLSDDDFTSLVIDIQYMPGFQLQPATVANLGSFLELHLNKPGGITIAQMEIPSPSIAVYTLDDVKEAESNHRISFNENTTIAVNVLIVDGAYEQDNVLGIAYRNTSLCLFGQVIHANSGGITQPARAKLETMILNHEFGHIMGLVDVGSDMVSDHKDDENGAHCNNSACLMYYAVQISDFSNFLMNNEVPGLDNACRQDIIANGGN